MYEQDHKQTHRVTVSKYSNFQELIEFDATKSGGDARRCTASAKAERMMGFNPVVIMEEGVKKTVEWYKSKLIPQ